MKFASRIFWVAGIYGLLAMLPLYFAENTLSGLFPPAITHPEFYYGFLGVGVAWQLCFILIARDPARLQPVMLPAIVEKLGFGLSGVVLVIVGRTPVISLVTAMGDVLFAVLFYLAYRSVQKEVM